MADLATRQHGAVARRQLQGLGLSTKQVRYLIQRGHLHPLHRGVYAVGHRRLTREGRWMAALLACGPGAVLSHLCAAMLWQLVAPFPSLPTITVGAKRGKRPGIATHFSSLPPEEVTSRNGIPTTTVARTLLDLASVIEAQRLERAIAEAEFRRYADSPSLPELVERHPRRRGLATLKAVLASGNVTRGVTRSHLEDRFLSFLDARRLERPELNAPLELSGGLIEVDCLWHRQRIALELDGRASHERTAQFEADRLRDRRLLSRGWRPMRVTARQLGGGAAELESDLRALGVGDTFPA